MLRYLLSDVFALLIIHWKHSPLRHSGTDFVDNLGYLFFWHWIHLEVIAWGGRSEIYDLLIEQCDDTPSVNAWFG